jgi:hypothetical protein
MLLRDISFRRTEVFDIRFCESNVKHNISFINVVLC